MEVTPTRRPPRRDPYQLFHIASDLAAGLAPHQIAAKHGLPLPSVLRIIRSRKDERLLNPFNLRQGAMRSHGGTQLYLFFFSSRRRHTRCSRDWSSDVCSSD